MYCPGCGYDLRGLGSDRCPECGLSIDAVHSGIIPWERRKGIGYLESFFRTLVLATFRPAQLARATGAPIDIRSARLFRWIVRLLAIMPCVLLFALAAFLNGGLGAMITIDGPGTTDPSWEPRFLWTAGAIFWPTLPVALALSCILATGIAPWFFMKRLEPTRRNRAMALSFYRRFPRAVKNSHFRAMTCCCSAGFRGFADWFVSSYLRRSAASNFVAAAVNSPGSFVLALFSSVFCRFGPGLFLL
jgi:hypothetical protein